jgi:metal-responsive CopG/Arc/MetJ family transcriptional regulator
MHMGMRSTVTIRDDLFEAADRVAARLGISRSRLYQIALEAYLRRLEEEALTEQMNALVTQAGEPSDEAFRQTIARAWKQSMGDDQW